MGKGFALNQAGIDFSKAKAAKNERRIAKCLDSAAAPMTIEEVAIKTGVSRAACFNRLKAMAERGLVEELSERRARTGKGCTAVLWRICEGALDEIEFEMSREKKRSAQVMRAPFRHPQDIAFFGEYERVAA